MAQDPSATGGLVSISFSRRGIEISGPRPDTKPGFGNRDLQRVESGIVQSGGNMRQVVLAVNCKCDVLELILHRMLSPMRVHDPACVSRILSEQVCPHFP